MDYFEYIETLDVAKRDVQNLVELYKMYPDSEQIGDISQKLLLDLYHKTIKILDMKKAAGDVLTSDEQKIYDNCKKALNQTSLRGALRISANVIDSIIGSFEAIYHILTWNWEEREIQQLLFKEGEKLLPGYIGFLTTLVDAFETYLIPDIALMPANMYDAAGIGERNYRTRRPDTNKAFAGEMLKFADFAYTGKEAYDKYQPLKKEELPEKIQIAYNAGIGIFKTSRGLKAWLAKNQDSSEIIIAYSGTELSSWNMIYADFLQINTASALYLEAAGLLSLMAEKYPKSSFLVSGHSLGGGLAQFAVTANINSLLNRVKCYAFNPAGLSLKSMDALKDEIIIKSKDYISVYVTTKDPISMTGAKFGNLIKLPSTESNGHGMKSLYRCMVEYIKGNEPYVDKKELEFNVLISASKKLSGWTTAGFRSLDKSINYPVFQEISSEAKVAMTVDFYSSVIKNIMKEDSEKASHFGVYEYFNGDSYTVMNRLLIFQTSNYKPLSLTREAAASCLFFGPYGYGNMQWFENMLASLDYENSPITRDNLDSYYSRMSNDYALMLDAVLYLLKNIYGYDFYDYFEKYSIAKTRAFKLFMDYDEKSNALYHKYNYDRTPLGDEYKEYINIKYDLFSQFLDECGSIAIKHGMLEEDTVKSIKSNILKYLTIFINQLTN